MNGLVTWVAPRTWLEVVGRSAALLAARAEDVASVGGRLCRLVAMDEIDSGSSFRLTLSIGAVLEAVGMPV